MFSKRISLISGLVGTLLLLLSMTMQSATLRTVQAAPSDTVIIDDFNDGDVSDWGFFGGDNAGGGGGAAGGIAGLVGGMLGGGGDEQEAAPAPQQAELQQANDQAVLMIRAMVNAAKSDGRVDETEQQNIISKLGSDVSEAEINFLKQEFSAPLDVAGFARSVPSGLEQQIYALSLTSIDLDTQNEAQYLGQLAQGLNIDANLCNQIHDQVGAPKIFG